jgi:hypothetical protein
MTVGGKAAPIEGVGLEGGAMEGTEALGSKRVIVPRSLRGGKKKIFAWQRLDGPERNAAQKAWKKPKGTRFLLSL